MDKYGPLNRLQNSYNQWADVLGLLSVDAILSVAFYFQGLYHELPCPLCVLQRLAFITVGLGFVFNLYLGRKPAHYGILALCSILGMAPTLRQQLLHIIPGSPSYGPALFGLHFYTWSAIAFISYLAFTAVTLLVYHPATDGITTLRAQVRKVTVVWFAIILLGNVLSTAAICGIGICPDNPTAYSFGK